MESQELQQLLETQPTWHVAILEYGMTHSVMRIALHQGDFPRYNEVILGGVVTFHGAMQGGPYRLQIRAPDAEGQMIIVDEQGQFEVQCTRITMGRIRR